MAVTVAYAALPTLVVQAVPPDETGVANAVNSIARSVGRALGSTLAVTFIAANPDPATGFPRDLAFTLVALTGAVSSAAVMPVTTAGLWAERHGRRAAGPPGIEAATAGAGEWSPVSGIR